MWRAKGRGSIFPISPEAELASCWQAICTWSAPGSSFKNAMMAEVSRSRISATGSFLGTILQELFEQMFALGGTTKSLDRLELPLLCKV